MAVLIYFEEQCFLDTSSENITLELIGGYCHCSLNRSEAFKFKSVIVSIETASSVIATELNAYRILLFSPPLSKICLCSFLVFSFFSL